MARVSLLFNRYLSDKLTNYLSKDYTLVVSIDFQSQFLTRDADIYSIASLLVTNELIYLPAKSGAPPSIASIFRQKSNLAII
jgi:hypothetical protein